MKILLKKEVCGSREQCTGPTDKCIFQSWMWYFSYCSHGSHELQTPNTKHWIFQQYPNVHLMYKNTRWKYRWYFRFVHRTRYGENNWTSFYWMIMILSRNRNSWSTGDNIICCVLDESQ